MIYLDNAATTRPSDGALVRAKTYLTECFYNPSALYHGGVEAARLIAQARAFLVEQVADPAQFSLVFTSCGTEADNQAIFSAARRGNAVTTQGEHAAVYESFKELKNRGVEPRFAPLHADGSVDADALLDMVDEKTTLVSVIHVSNETGAINDIAAIARRVKQKNPRAVFMSDGVQAFGKIGMRLTKDIDLYTVSAHKIGGLKGTGALLRRKGYTALSAYVHGGGQESGLRSGTENVFGIAAFLYAAQEKFATLEADAVRVAAMKEMLWSMLDKACFACLSPQDGSPYILTVSAGGARGETLQRMLWDRGVVLGTGSACNSKKPHSRVLQACGYDGATLDGVLRASFSSGNTQDEAMEAARAMNEAARSFGG